MENWSVGVMGNRLHVTGCRERGTKAQSDRGAEAQRNKGIEEN